MDRTFTKEELFVKKSVEHESQQEKNLEMEPDESVLSFLSQFSRVYCVSKVVTSMSSVIPITMMLN